MPKTGQHGAAQPCWPERKCTGAGLEGLFLSFSSATNIHHLGTWCSGITSTSHAEGPGFKSQCVHFEESNWPFSPHRCANQVLMPLWHLNLSSFLLLLFHPAAHFCSHLGLKPRACLNFFSHLRRRFFLFFCIAVFSLNAGPETLIQRCWVFVVSRHSVCPLDLTFG